MTSLLAVAPAASAADFTWSGAGASPAWSDANNWTPAGAPSGTIGGNLNFPDLPTCVAPAPCYTSNDDISGINANGLVFTNISGSYSIKSLLNNSLTIGSNGISDTNGSGVYNSISLPLVLAGSQTWSIGGNAGTAKSNGLTVFSSTVSGASSSLSVAFPTVGPGSGSGDLRETGDIEVGPVAISGFGKFHDDGSVNYTDTQPVTVGGGATFLAPTANLKAGPLTINSVMQVGSLTGGGSLAVNGAATLHSGSSTTMYVTGSGSTAGTDYSQLSATSATVGGTLSVTQGTGCPALAPGTTYTLITTTGALSGTFTNAANGAVIPMMTSCPGTAAQVEIQYTANSVTATVIGTTTALATGPSPATTNQPVTITATVTNYPSSVPPSGSVTFFNNGIPIANCSTKGVSGTGNIGTATCTTSFAADSTPESLTATFTGNSGQATSSSPAQPLTVGKDSTTTSVSASNSSPTAGGSVTYTAKVSPAHSGSILPAGTVAFSDGGSPIPGCASQPLSLSTATCKVTYANAGSHLVMATVSSDANFTGSTSSAVKVTVQSGPTPPGPTSASATTSAATQLGTTQATLHGSVTTGGVAVSWQFQYGPRTAYGKSTPLQSIAAGKTGAVSVSSALKQLSPNTRYHYRLVVRASTTVTGKDMAFTTKPTGSLVGPTSRLSVVGRTVALTEKCQSNRRCNARFSITATVRSGKKLKTVVCATGSFSIKAHRRRTVKARLSGRCLALLHSKRRLAAKFTAQLPTGQRSVNRKIALVLG